MMRTLVVSSLVMLIGSACSGSPVAPTLPPPGATDPRPLPAAPKAVLLIGPSDTNPPIAVLHSTPLLFDGSHSIGERLTYRLEFGDGASSTQPFAEHRVDAGSRRPQPERLMKARLTVTDAQGRTDSTEQTYFLAGLGTGFSETWTSISDPERDLYLTQEGTTLSGRLVGPESNRPFEPKRVTGTLTEGRGVRLRTEDGAVEMIGTVEWGTGNFDGTLVLRLSMKGGTANGAVLDFFYGHSTYGMQP